MFAGNLLYFGPSARTLPILPTAQKTGAPVAKLANTAVYVDRHHHKVARFLGSWVDSANMGPMKKNIMGK